jgi:hypothetical protein
MVGVILAAAVVAFGTFVFLPGGDLDGPCISAGGDFMRKVPEGGSAASETSFFPPGIRCVAELPGGSTIEEMHPGPITWLVAALALISPLLAPMIRPLRQG